MDCSRMLWLQERQAKRVIRVASELVEWWDETEEWVTVEAMETVIDELKAALKGKPEPPVILTLFGYSGIEV